MADRVYKLIATLGFVGYMPVAPGTFGTAVSLLLVTLLKPDNLELVLIFLPAFLLGVLTSHNAEKALGKDSGHIIIDEFCGYLLCVLFVPKNTGYLIAAFFLFRFFDVLKPPPIRRIERIVPGGAGIMLDDLLAGVYTNICIQVWRHLF
ncbi:MAG: phosphatidylglycerophosphatase A [Nitrospirae bacterium]|nr:phosphatidylglycerophosphatase A [Nitrospirota bacterium]